jgi:polar amino acid transport system permease protein
VTSASSTFGPGSFFFEVWRAREVLAAGVGVTIFVAACAIAAGMLFGCVFGVGLAYGPRPVRWLLRGFSDVIRGTPVLVLIFFGYYGVALLGINVGPMVAGIIALAAFCTAHWAEIMRGALQSIPQAQTDAAMAIGLGFWGRLRYALMPQALRRAIPAGVNTAVEMVKATTLLSLIGVVDLLLTTQQAISRSQMVLEFYAAALLVYILINMAVSQAGRSIERRMAHIRF